MPNKTKTPTVLPRFLDQDTPVGVSTETLSPLMAQTGINMTETIHHALHQLHDRNLLMYVLDDGPLSNEQVEAIKSASPDLADEQLTRALF